MMKKLLVPAMILASVSAVALPAAAQNQSRAPQHNAPSYSQSHSNWQSIADRRAGLERRIDQAVRNGAMSRREATSVRADLNALVRMETNYRRGGLTARERSDLDRRFDRISAQVRTDSRGPSHGNNGNGPRR
jgi:hypothetical protein